MFTLKPASNGSKPAMSGTEQMLMSFLSKAGFDPSKIMSMFTDAQGVVLAYTQKADANHLQIMGCLHLLEKGMVLLERDNQALRSELQDARIEILTRIQALEERITETTPAGPHDAATFPVVDNLLELAEDGSVIAKIIPVDAEVISHYGAD